MHQVVLDMDKHKFVDFESYKLLGERRDAIALSLRRPPFNRYVFPFDVAQLAQSQPKRLLTGRRNIAASQPSDPRHFGGLLRQNRNAKRQERGAEKAKRKG